eukprot:m.195630 g.195630  ORF g.195630 m.195630 type:complete len:148 (+) comp14893_c0_seq5:73-516(+)
MRRLLLSGLVVGGAIAGCATACYSHRTPHLQPYRLQWLQPERCFAQSPESTTLGFFGQHGYWSERFQPMIEHNTTEEWTTSLTHPKVAEAFEALDKNGLVSTLLNGNWLCDELLLCIRVTGTGTSVHCRSVHIPYNMHLSPVLLLLS